MSEQPPAFVDEFAGALASLGFSRMPARVFCLLLATPEESLTAREIAETLGISRAAVSGAVRYLEQIRLLGRSRARGERVDRFGLGTEIWTPVFELELQSYGPLREVCTRAVSSGQLGGRGAERVAETAEFLSFMATEMTGMLERWRSRRS